MSTLQEWIASKKDYENDVIELDELKITKISPQLKAELEKFKSLNRLTMIACDLKSFENFPNLPGLAELDLTDNKIKGEELRNIPYLAELRELCLSSNPINSLNDIKTLARFNKSIEVLLLEETPLAKNVKDYRKQIFQIIGGTLVNVDLEDKFGNEIVEDSDVSDDDDQDDADDVEDLLDDEDDVDQDDGGEDDDDGEQESPAPASKKQGSATKGTKGKPEPAEDSQDEEDYEGQDSYDDESDQEPSDEPQKRVKRK